MDKSMKIRHGDSHSITDNVILKTVGFLSGHSRLVDERPRPGPRPRHPQHQSTTMVATDITQPEPLRRTKTEFQPPPTYPELPRRTHSLTPIPWKNTVPEPDEQTQSPLFKLPEELLLDIYEEVIGKTTFHIVRRSHKLGHTTCHYNTAGSQEECKECGCRGLKVPSGLHVEAGPGHGGLIQLLQTCRKIYIDGIQILYASNTFDFDSMESLIFFSKAIPSRRFDSITSLQLDFRFNLSLYFSESPAPNDWPRWERTWRIIASMKSLQHIWCRISWFKLDLYAVEEAKRLEPLSQMIGLKTFEVSLPRLKSKEVQKAKYPFHVIRRTQ